MTWLSFERIRSTVPNARRHAGEFEGLFDAEHLEAAAELGLEFGKRIERRIDQFVEVALNCNSRS